jgi:hypothetical protein
VKDNSLRKRYESISIMLDGFNLARIQEYYGLMTTLKEFEISDDEFKAWVRFVRAEGHYARGGEKGNELSYYCPNCGGMVSVLEVNSKSCNNVGGDYKSMFSCDDLTGCGYSRYSSKDVSSWISMLRSISKPAAMAHMMKESKGCGGCGSK